MTDEVKDTGPESDCQKLFRPGGLLSKRLSRYEYRETQAEMAKQVAEALERDATLLVEAPTGTGKTWAYLIPAALSGKRVVISTGTKTLQDQLFRKDLPFLASSLPRPFRYRMMKGKANYLCLHLFNRFLDQPTFPDVDDLRGRVIGGNGNHIESDFQRIHRWSMETSTGDRSELTGLSEASPLWREVTIKGEECLGKSCPVYDRCYITRMKQEAAESDLIIVNHHLFFADLALRDSSFGEVLPRYDAVIFDEAHLLEEVAVHHFGVGVSSRRVEELLRDIDREIRFSRAEGRAVSDESSRVLAASNRFFRFFDLRGMVGGTTETIWGGREQTVSGVAASLEGPPDRYPLPPSFFSDEAVASGQHLLQSLDLLRRRIETLPTGGSGLARLSERTSALSADLHLFLAPEGGAPFVLWGEGRKQGVSLYASPLDVSALLREKLFDRGIPIVLTSATLSSVVMSTGAGGAGGAGGEGEGGFSFLKERLGIIQAEGAILSSPFDYRKQALLYLPTDLPVPSHPGFGGAISAEIVRILAASGGRAFLLFTSWKQLEEVYRNISGKVPYPLLKQGDQPKQALLETFQRESPSVLLGTASFWQGVDVEGEALSCVVIDKLPFASPADPLVAARIELLARRGKDPFRSYQLPAAMLALRQGIGRLIRNRRDRGVIAILDRRLTRKGYGRYFLESLPPCPRTDRFEVVEAFFAAESQGLRST
ncbi:MAG: ATP-dependent DNA helicase [Candidatus Manganitrophaceae bacterium]